VDGSGTEAEQARLRKLRDARSGKLAAMQESQRDAIETHGRVTANARLDFLMQQAEVFSHFVREDGASAGASKRGRKKAAGAGSPSGRRAKGRKSENEEDQELVAAAMDGPESTGRLTKQPSMLKFGTLRDYQLEALNWLINLYDTGINGILAEYV